MNFHLIWNWNDSWKWISMQTAAAVTVLNTIALGLPHEWAHYIQTLTVILTGLTMFGRLIQQTPPGPGMPDRTIQAEPGETVAVHVKETKP